MPLLRRPAACMAALATLLAAAAAADESRLITRRFTQADQEHDRYVYLPFEVPEGAVRVRVAYAYDRAAGQNTIDLGLFEPGSLELGTTSMRGYSGGARSEVVLTPSDATPGYRAGPIPPGRWHVMLGLYSVAESGVDVEITIGVSTTAPAEPRWWSGALHTHTVHSDGSMPAIALLDRVRSAGLDFVAITDHNNTTHREDVLSQGRPASPLWIVGEEVTTPAGHANVWGLGAGAWIDFRVRPQDRRVGELVDAAHRHGALFSINHPTGECDGCSWDHELPADLDAIEVWNGRHGAQDRAVAIWERLLREGRRVTAVGASDWHRDPDPIDSAHVRVLAPALTEPSVLRAIRDGRVIIMRAASDQTPTFTVRAGPRVATVGDTVEASGSPATLEVVAPGLEDGRVVFVVNGARLPPVPVSGSQPGRVQRTLEPGYVRCEIYAAGGALVALTNPVFVTR